MLATRQEALLELAKRRARKNLLAYTLFTWEHPTPYIVGRHTRAICARLTKAIEDWRAGKSTYLLISVPFRHGKSELCSISLPTYFLGSCADLQPSIILSGYGAALIRQFSEGAIRKVLSERYQTLFAGVEVEGRIDDWHIKGSVGRVTAVGLGGALTGKGGDLLVLDDYCKSRSEAVSKAYREATWDGFRNDFFTRRHDPSIVVITATPWHIDDLRGRILREMEQNEHFPRFEELSFPARKVGEYDYLFPERFSPEWYEAQRSVLGKQAAALMDCEPIIEGGNRFDVQKVIIHDTLDDFPRGARYSRAWDLASSVKQRDSDDPDRTWGIKGTVTSKRLAGGVTTKELWITSMVAIRAEAPARNALIRSTAQSDGMGVSQYIEAFAAYKDAYVELKQALHGISIVKPSRLSGDKSAKLAPLEPLFEGGAVHIYRPACKEWLDTWLAEFAAFPSGSHDDSCDATAVLFHSFESNSGSSFLL